MTFFSHYDAQMFAKRVPGSRVRPVPRSISSSCGDCVSVSSGLGDDVISDALDGIAADSLFGQKDGRYVLIRAFSDS